MQNEVIASPRSLQGTGASRRLRKTGKVPGILYGGKSQPVTIELDHNDLFHKLRNEKFHASILDLVLDGGKEQVLLRSFNMHPWKPQVQHIDFQRVLADEKIHMKVPLHFVNAELSPGVKEQNGVPNHVVNELNITCFPDDLPEFIEVDMGAMKIGDAIHVLDLKLPKGVEPVSHRGDNPVVATVTLPAAAVEEESTAAPSAADVPASKQSDPAKDDKAAGDKGGDKKK